MRRLLLIALVVACGCGVELEHGLDERQANQVTAVLAGAGIAADKVRDGDGRFKVVVPRGAQSRAFQVLERHDLPRRGQHGLGEAFSGSRILPSAVEERARLMAALKADLERSLEGLAGVLSAHVHLALPEADPLAGAAPARPTASVLLRSEGALPIQEDDVRRLVSGAVPSLDAEAVSVVVARVEAAPPAPPLYRLGPLQVSAESRDPLVRLLVSALVLLVLLAVLMVLAAVRLERLRRRLKALERPPGA